MKNRIMQKVLDERNSAKTALMLDAEKLREQAYSIPDISDAQKAYSAAKFEALFKTGDLATAAVVKAKNAYLSALSKHGFSEGMFIPAPLCSLCNDSGNYNGALCSCIKTAYVKALAEECDVYKRAPFSFDDSNPVKADEAQKSALEKLYASMEAYVDKYPSVKYTLLVFSGATGTGKSCLASAMARKSVLVYGRSALMLSAYELNNVCLTCHTSYVSERARILHDVMTVDMLVVDDLGTEPMLKNVTVEYLQLLIEERNRAGLTTVITTNLNSKQLLARYGERIFSRLNDKSNSLMKRIPGKDMRIS